MGGPTLAPQLQAFSLLPRSDFRFSSFAKWNPTLEGKGYSSNHWNWAWLVKWEGGGAGYKYSRTGV